METLGLIQRSFPLIRIVVANRIVRLTRLCFPVKTKNKKSDRKELCVTQKSETKQELKKKIEIGTYRRVTKTRKLCVATTNKQATIPQQPH